MKLRVTLLSLLKVAVLGAGLSACGGASGKLMVDTPVLPYKAPDIDEITGTDDFDEVGEPPATNAEAASASAAGSAAGSGSAAKPGK